jgi:hypothetical protein
MFTKEKLDTMLNSKEAQQVYLAETILRCDIKQKDRTTLFFFSLLKDAGVSSENIDNIWGVGLGIGDPRLDHEDQWLGQNLLGKAINDAQKMIIQEYLKV